MTPSPSPPFKSKSAQDHVQDDADCGIDIIHNYGSTTPVQTVTTKSTNRSMLHSLTSLKDAASRVAFLESTKTHHHHGQPPDGDNSTLEGSLLHRHPSDDAARLLPTTARNTDPTKTTASTSNNQNSSTPKQLFFSHTNLRKLALDLSLYINIFILLTKAIAYLETLSLSILAALVDSILDVVSQWILNYTEKRMSRKNARSSAHYPAGASRLEPLGVLSCAALMGFASFGVLKEALEKLYEGTRGGGTAADTMIIISDMDENWSSVWTMVSVVFVKLALWGLCKKVGRVREEEANGGGGGGGNVTMINSGGDGESITSASSVLTPTTNNNNSINNNTTTHTNNTTLTKYYVDSTLEALALDHWNDCLSNAVAAIALLCALSNDHLWILDPIGAIVISLYIIFSWYSTGKEQIEQLTGKAAPAEFIDELYEMANNFDVKMEVDVVRAYHFGPKFLVELEVVLPRDTLLFESHDLGMELQYEIESREEVERCFVHIDYESRPYDEHVVSKVPELRERYRPKLNSAVSI